MRRWFSFLAPTALLGFATTASADPTEPGTLVNPIADADDCDYCHTFPNPEDHMDESPFAPFVTWQGSMMGNTARDPVFWAGVAVAEADHADEVPECIRCHVPAAFLEDRATLITSRDDLVGGAELTGVNCDFCHRMTDQGAIGNAQYNIDDVPVDANVPRRGPWDYTDGVPLPIEHSTMQDTFTGSSELCGTCHDVTVPRERVDDDGVPMGRPFNEQRTYSEWANSAFAVEGDDFASCQDCHMSSIDDSAACNTYAGSQSHPTGNRRHDLIGANRFMLQVIQQNFSDEVSPSAFDIALARLDEFVQTAATMEVTAPDSVHLGEGLEGLEVTVTNETGHKLPSGYSEGRVMWIEVVASYDGTPVWTSGQWDSEALEYEEDAQLRTYQGIAEEYSSGTTFHLLLNDHWVVDSRIPPRGMVADIETDPVGDRYTLQGDNTWPHWDTHTYSFDAANEVQDTADEDVLDVRVRLLYLINTDPYMQFLAGESEAGQDVLAMFDALGGAQPVELAAVDLQIPIDGFGGGDTGTSSSGSTTGGTTDDTASATATMTAAGTMSGTSPTTDPSGGSETDTDTAAGDDGGDGCGCRSGGEAGWLLLLLLPFVTRRGRFGRRRTTRRRRSTSSW